MFDRSIQPDAFVRMTNFQRKTLTRWCIACRCGFAKLLVGTMRAVVTSHAGRTSVAQASVEWRVSLESKLHVITNFRGCYSLVIVNRGQEFPPCKPLTSYLMWPPKAKKSRYLQPYKQGEWRLQQCKPQLGLRTRYSISKYFLNAHSATRRSNLPVVVVPVQVADGLFT